MHWFDGGCALGCLIFMKKTHYQRLGVAKTATTDDIKRAYRRLIRDLHPDAGGQDSEQVQQLNHAYETLRDPKKRTAYDKTLQADDFGEQVWRFFDKAQNSFRQNVRDNVAFLKSLKGMPSPNFDDAISVQVYPWQAIFGDKVAIKTNFHHLLVPMPAFADRTALRIKGAGKPDGQGGFGDLVITFTIKVPSLYELNDQQKALWQHLKENG